MSDIEEPPAKISKTEVTAQSEELEEMEEGQEEWLSEGLLTDDDNYPSAEQDGTESNIGNTSQEDLDETFLDETMLSEDHSMDGHNVSQDTSHGNITQEPETGQEIPVSQKPPERAPETIEQTLNNLENRSAETTEKRENTNEVTQEKTEKHDKSDGNDTDDLLRLLGDNDEKLKKKVLVKTKDKNGKSRSLKNKDKTEEDTGSSDDEYIFNSSTVQKLRLAKNALIKKPATKAVPEDMSEGDDETDCESLEEATTMKNIFEVKKPTNKASKSTTKPPYPSQPVKKVVKIANTNIVKSTTKPPYPSQPTRKVVKISNTNIVKSTTKPPYPSQPTRKVIKISNTNIVKKITKPPYEETYKESRKIGDTNIVKKTTKPPYEETYEESRKIGDNNIVKKTTKPPYEETYEESRKIGDNNIVKKTTKPPYEESRKIGENNIVKKTTRPPYEETYEESRKIGDNNIEILSHKPAPKRPNLLKTSTPSKPVLRSATKSINTSTPVKTLIMPPVKKEVKEIISVSRTESKSSPGIIKPLYQKKPPPSEHEEIINEKEFLEEDDFDLEDDFPESLDMDHETSRNSQMIMKPEQMDEEIPTDAESHTDSDASVYDELPSSDSEDIDDWFSLDIRDERASDILPLLGEKAYELLTEEKRRVAERLSSLRQNVATLHKSGQIQAEQLRKAAVTLAELDDMLKAA